MCKPSRGTALGKRVADITCNVLLADKGADTEFRWTSKSEIWGDFLPPAHCPGLAGDFSTSVIVLCWALTAQVHRAGVCAQPPVTVKTPLMPSAIL